MSSTLLAPNVDIAGQSNYAGCLSLHWAQHLQKRNLNAPTVISLFAGAGGSSLGYSMAGYRELLAVEWDNAAVQTFRLNFPNVPLCHGDISKLSDNECLSIAGLSSGELDILDGSPPCQGFSTAGKRVASDDRNFLFKEYSRLLGALMPKYFIMENVSGMIKGKMKLIFSDILRSLKNKGYSVVVRLMDAKYFNVPQSRERVIFIGTRADIKTKANHPLGNMRPLTASTCIIGADTSCILEARGNSAEKLKYVKPGLNIAKQFGTPSHGFNYHRCPSVGPCRTILKTVSYGSVSIYHPFLDRNMSIGEIKRIGSFPDEFVFPGSYRDSVAQIGNSVPPLFMCAIAKHMRNYIDK